MNLRLPNLNFDGFDLTRLVATVVLIIAAAVFARIAKRVVVKYIEEPQRRYRASKLVGRFTAIALLLGLVLIWTPGRQAVLTILTVIGAGLAISMREALLSVAGWANLVLRESYRQGDRIEVNGVKGDVVDIRLLHTTLMEVGSWVDAEQSTGRLVHIPNQWIYLHGVHNYSHGFNFIWNEMSVTLTPESDWQAARDLMMEMANETSAIVEAQARSEIRHLSREYLVHYSVLTPFVYVSFADRGIKLTLRYLCEVRKRRGTEHAFTISLLESFKAHGNIELVQLGTVGH